MCNESPDHHGPATLEAKPQPAVVRDHREAVREAALHGLEEAAVEPKAGADYISMT